MSQQPHRSARLGAEGPGATPVHADKAHNDRVQCPNCCRLAPVTSRRMGLLFFECELCLTSGATPEPTGTPD